MMHDIFIPCRLGNYYLHKTRILTIEVTSALVRGLLLKYSGNNVILQKNITIFLKELTQQAQINAIKKIISSVGKVDEVVTTLSSSAIVFKELELPFIGRETLKLVIPFEVEAMLPFPLDESVIDFIITQENFEKKSSTVLVAAVRKEDVQIQFDLFQKADISLELLTIDVFALYQLYHAMSDQGASLKAVRSSSKMNSLARIPHKIYTTIRKAFGYNVSLGQNSSLDNFQPKRSEVLIDIGFDSIKLLYLIDGVLGGVRVIPFGVADCLQRMSQELNVSSYELVTDLFGSNSSEKYIGIFIQEMQTIFNEISRTFLYFEQQRGIGYLAPHKITMSGFCTQKTVFLEMAKKHFGSIVELFDINRTLQFLRITSKDQNILIPEQTLLLSTDFVWQNNPDNNLLQDLARKSDNKLLYMQLLAMICASIVCIGGTWWRSSQTQQSWLTSYNASKKQFVQTLEQEMNIDLKGEKNLKTMIEQAEQTLKRERALWFSFMKQNESSVLEYLQDLSIAIDRVSLGLELKQMHLDYEKVTMTGSVKNFEALDLFDEELQSLKLLTVVEKPRELSWTIQLQPKSMQKGSA